MEEKLGEDEAHGQRRRVDGEIMGKLVRGCRRRQKIDGRWRK